MQRNIAVEAKLTGLASSSAVAFEEARCFATMIWNGTRTQVQELAMLPQAHEARRSGGAFQLKKFHNDIKRALIRR